MKVALSISSFILPDVVVKAFHDLADAQRGEPEKAMLRIQHMGGGVLSVLVEHTGDLIHRMTDAALHGYFGENEVKEKCERILRYLRHPYGFPKELLENAHNNSRGDFETYKSTYIEKLRAYYQAHQVLPAYNAMHLLAKDATIALAKGAIEVLNGNTAYRYFNVVEGNTEALLHAIQDGSYNDKVSKYTLEDGQLTQYRG